MRSLSRRVFATLVVASSVSALAGCTRSVLPTSSMVGQRAPEWVLKTADGRRVGSEVFRAERKPYVLFFWATW